MLTAYAGVPPLARAARLLGVPGSVKRSLKVKQRERGFDKATYVEGFLVLNALGGACLEDFDRLREDQGLCEMLGHELPRPEAARKFLYAFHEEERIERAQVNQDLVQQIGRRCPNQKIATVNVDASVIESCKREAQPSYEGVKRYQPLLALWTEMNLALADGFRYGNVPAHSKPLPVTKRVFAALPESVVKSYFRGGAGCWGRELVNWLHDEQRPEGPRGPSRFAISVRMTPTAIQTVKQPTAAR